MLAVQAARPHPAPTGATHKQWAATATRPTSSIRSNNTNAVSRAARLYQAPTAGSISHQADQFQQEDQDRVAGRTGYQTECSTRRNITLQLTAVAAYNNGWLLWGHGLAICSAGCIEIQADSGPPVN
jgi:hypothetical protein